MSKRTSEALTPRQRQSQQIMREKAARKKRQAIVKKAQIAGAATIAVLLLGGGLWSWKSGVVGRVTQSIADGAYRITARSGFAVQSLYLEGRNRTSMDEINQALAVKKGDPIFQLSLSDMRERLEKIESVQFAAVERALPGTLYIRIVEREPVALWQHNGQMALVDDHGVVMKDIDSKPYQHLPLIVGNDAPAHVGELLALLASEPDLGKRFAAAVRVGDRRWDIHLSGNVEVKLPEDDAQAAWKKLADLETKEQLLDRDVKVIDLRLPDRLFIKLAPDELPSSKAMNAKDT